MNSTASTGTTTATEADLPAKRNPFECAPKAAPKAQANQPTLDPTKRLMKWACFRFALADLPQNQKWARDLAWKIENQNARNDITKGPRTLVIKGDQAVSAGATDDQLNALRPLSPEEYNDLQIAAQAEHEAAKMRVRDMARRINAAGACPVTPPEPVSLADLLDEPDEAQTYRVDRLWPSGGRVLLSAQYKAGKSTLVGNVIRSLVDGPRLLGTFDVTPVKRVVLIDTELDKSMLRRWLREQKISKTEAVSVIALRGAVSTFDILDPAVRTEWVQRIGEADVVILDCLRPILDALALSEDKDAGRALVAFDSLLAEVGATEGMVVTHMGHHNERARGDSRLLDWPDALWKIVRDGKGGEDDDTADTRYFSALGRDVALGEGQLHFDAATRHLTYQGGSRQDADALVALPELVAMVRLEPGTLSKNKAMIRLKDDHGITQKAARAAIRKATRPGGALRTEKGDRNADLLFPNTDDPFTIADG